ncbi:MAG: hypothetical protein ABF649_00700 [Bacillus sp. (in: firmicutes)]
MALVIITVLILITFVTYVKLSMDHQQKLINKIIAGSYKEYKLEQRADEAHTANIELVKKQQEEEIDPDYL